MRMLTLVLIEVIPMYTGLLTLAHNHEGAPGFLSGAFEDDPSAFATDHMIWLARSKLHNPAQ